MKVNGYEVVSYRIGDRTVDLYMKELMTPDELNTLIKYLKLEIEMLDEDELTDTGDHWLLDAAKG